MLESQQLTKRVAKAGDRQDYLQVVEDAFAHMVEAEVARVRPAAADIEESLRNIPESEMGSRQRVADTAAFYRAMGDGLDMTAKALRKNN